MLLPDKHITLAESILGLGAFVIQQLAQRSQSVDRLHAKMAEAMETPSLPAFHNFDDLLLAILFLYSIDAVELTDIGSVKLCVS